MNGAADTDASQLERHLSQAISEARERLAGFDGEIAELEAKRNALIVRRAQYSALIKASRALLSDDGDRTAETERTYWDTISEAGEVVSPGGVPPLPQPAHMKRGVAPDSSVYRVGLILREAQVPMTREEIVADYKRRGWLDPDWKDPDSSLTQAMRRASAYGWATRKPGTWTFVTTQPPVTSDAASGAGANKQPEGGA